MMKTLILGLLLVGLTANASTAADAVRERNPELAQHVASLQPMKNRAGKYYFPDAQLVSPDAQVLVTERLLGGDDEPAVQVALAYALDGKHRLPWTVISTQSADVRAALLSGYKKHGAIDAVEALSGGLADASDAVQFEAVRLLGRRPDLKNARLVEGLKQALRSDVVDVRWAAVRALAWRDDAGAFEAIQPLLVDKDAKVRGAAIRSLGILDKARALDLSGVDELRNDPNPHVKRAFRSLARD